MDGYGVVVLERAAQAAGATAVTTTMCPECGYSPQSEFEMFGGFERDGMMFTVCPKCGADWPD